MTQQTIQHLANQLNQRYFNHSLTCKVIFNKRLRTTGGRFTISYNRKTGSKKDWIEINPKIIQWYPKQEPQDTIKHELIHRHLWEHGLPNGHTKKFVYLAHHVLHCNVYMPANFGISRYYIYQCPACGQTFAMKTHTYCNCGNCGNRLDLIKTVSYAQLHTKPYPVDVIYQNFKKHSKVINRKCQTFYQWLSKHRVNNHTLATYLTNSISKSSSKLLKRDFKESLNVNHLYLSEQLICRLMDIIDFEKLGHYSVSPLIRKYLKQYKNTSQVLIHLNHYSFYVDNDIDWHPKPISRIRIIKAINYLMHLNYHQSIQIINNFKVSQKENEKINLKSH